MRTCIACVVLLFAGVARVPAADRAWSAEGRVTDGQGNGLPGVTVRASCGMGTLMPTGSTTTDANGHYQLRFGPGFHSPGASVADTAVQAAVITAWKDDYYEQNLSRQGDLLLAGALPKPNRHYSPDRVILPNVPRRIDYVMLPAAALSGTVVDSVGDPVSGMRIYVDGDELGPASSVHAQITTDADGHFSLSVPCKAYRFVPAARDDEVARTSTIPFDRPGPYQLKLIFDQRRKEMRVAVTAAP